MPLIFLNVIKCCPTNIAFLIWEWILQSYEKEKFRQNKNHPTGPIWLKFAWCQNTKIYFVLLRLESLKFNVLLVVMFINILWHKTLFRNHDFPKKVSERADPPWFIHSMKRCLDKWILLNLIKSDPPPTHPLSNRPHPKRKSLEMFEQGIVGCHNDSLTCICFTLVVAQCDFHHKLQHQHYLVSISPFMTKTYGNNFPLQSRYE